MVSLDHAKRHVETANGTVIALLTQMQITPEIAAVHDSLSPLVQKFAVVVYDKTAGEVNTVRTFDHFEAADTAYVGEAAEQGLSVPRKTLD